MSKRRAAGPLLEALTRTHPDLEDPAGSVLSGRVLVDGHLVTNPRSTVGRDSHISVRDAKILRGEPKLRAALETFGIDVEGKVALDAGAAAGGFCKVLLEWGAKRVYAVDAGHGQLLGSLRQHHRIVTLENTNLSQLDERLVPEPIDLITLDLSYISLSLAIPQLGRLRISESASMVCLVKPMFELHLPTPPGDASRLEAALDTAMRGVTAAGWEVLTSMESPVVGSRGAVEFLLHARASRRRAEGPSTAMSTPAER